MRYALGLLLVGVAISIQSLHAQGIPRTVLALYDGRVVQEPWQSAVHRLAEMPLNHLGLVVRYHDVNQPLPSVDDIPDLRGILVWEALNMVDPRRFVQWVGEAVGKGARLVVVGGFDEPGPNGLMPDQEAAIARFWELLGMRSEQEWIPFTYNSRIVYRNPQVVDFERKVAGVLPGYERLIVEEGAGYSCLRVRRGGRSDSDSDLVAITRTGGWIASGYAYFHNEETDTVLWYVNPFEFFRRALATDDLPKPDTTTLVGRRLFFSHIDGDGWNNLTEIHPYRHKGVLSAEIVEEKIIRAHPDLPVTVAPIAGDLDPRWHGTPKSRKVARKIFSLPQVEAASHTYSHPYDWQFFADGDPDKERPFLPFYRKPWDGREGGERRGARETRYYRETGYVTPRAYAVEPFDLRLEIDGSVEFVASLLPPGKRVKVFQWSGDTNPFAAAIERTRRLGIYNINGGDTRLDRKYPSYGWVSPLSREVEGERQIYASNSNENLYTDHWSEQFFGYRHLIRTLKNTETPLRVKPVGIYYHMYSGQKLSSLNAVLANIRFARGQAIVPVATSRYAAIVEGFFNTRMIRLGERRWRIENRGALQTVRFDRAVFAAVDFERSRGVLGQRHYQGSLYVALDESVAAPVVALEDYEESGQSPVAAVPYLLESRWRIWGLIRGKQDFRFIARGFGEGEMVWKVPRAGHYQIEIARDGLPVEIRSLAVDESRILSMVLPYGDGPRTVRVRVEYRRQETV